MAYFTCYLLVGLLLVIFKTPIREIVDREVRKLDIQYLLAENKVPPVKIILFRIILSTVLIFIYPLMLYVEMKDPWTREKAVMPFKRLKNKIRKSVHIRKKRCCKPVAQSSWLEKTPISVLDVEAKHMVSVDGANVPFGYVQDNWKNLLEKMEAGDKLFEFSSSKQSWKGFAGREGVALVRGDKIVADIVTSMN